MFRRKKIGIILFFLIFISAISIVLLFLANTGLEIKTENIINSDKSSILLTLENNSNHIINNIEIYNNNTKLEHYDVLNVNEEKTYVIETKDEINNVIVYADKHIPFEKQIQIKLPKTNSNVSNAGFTYNLKYDAFIVDLVNIIELTICNNGDATVLNVELEENDYFNMENNNVQLIISDNVCEKATFTLVPTITGKSKLVFNIFNAYYSKRLESNIDIIE